VNQEHIDAGFDHVRSERFPRAHRTETRDPGVRPALKAHLTIAERPIPPEPARARVEPAVVAHRGSLGERRA
jgi:hypothetical protein